MTNQGEQQKQALADFFRSIGMEPPDENSPEAIQDRQLAEERAEKQRLRTEREQVERERKYRAAFDLQMNGIPVIAEVRDDIYSGALDRTDAVRAVDEWLATKTPFLVLRGGVGTGKTVASAYAIARTFGAYVPARRLRSLVTRDTWDLDGGNRERGNYDPFEASSLVVLDDLGAEADDAVKFNDALLELVEWRQVPGKRLIITTNLTRDRIRERYDARFVDRLIESAKSHTLTGHSMRKPKGA